jgi:hypothetical protein
MEETLKQWIDVHGVSVYPHIEHEIEGHTRREWRTEAGDVAIEAFTISGMGHGVPLASGSRRERCGNAGPFHFDVGLSSSHHIVRFWGLTDNFTYEKAADRSRTYSVPTEPRAQNTSSLAVLSSPFGGSRRSDDIGKYRESHAGGGTSRDPSGVIAAALKAAGLLSEREPSGHPGDLLDPRRVITATLKTVGLLKK